MSECLPKDDRIVICSEITSNDYKITTEEILCHAKKLGVSVSREPYLLPLVIKGLIHPLPVDWIPCYDTESQDFFYYNRVNGVSQWEHPIDEYYQNLIAQIKDGNLFDYLNLEGSFTMLPLRHNRKPQLLPIKQLLKYKDEEKSSTDDGVLKSNLPSSLKTKNESNSHYKKTVSFASNKWNSFPEKESLNLNQNEEILRAKNAWDSDIFDRIQGSADYSKVYGGSLNNSDDDSKPGKNLLHTRSERKKTNFTVSPTTSKQSSDQNKASVYEKPLSKNFKRLQINLRHPDPFLFSDSNRDDTIENMVSESVSSEMISEEEETPHNILTNVTESGIDVNTVTDIQKLKAKNKRTNLLTHGPDTPLNESTIDVEQNLYFKLETKIVEEIAKLKKYFNDSALNVEHRNNREIILKETEESLRLFQRDIEKRIEKSNEIIDSFKSLCNQEVNDLKDTQQKYLDIVNSKYDKCNENIESSQKQTRDFVMERLSNLEQSLTKKLETIKIENETMLEKFKIEKEKAFSEFQEKFQSFVKETEKNKEKFLHDDYKNVVWNIINELFTKEIGDGNFISRGIEKIIRNILNEGAHKMSTVDQKTIATQTENISNSEELLTMKEKIKEISFEMKHLSKEMQDVKKIENISVPLESLKQKYVGSSLSKERKELNNEISVPFLLRENNYKTDFTPFEEFSSGIDKELDCYRKKYILSNSKWLLSK